MFSLWCTVWTSGFDEVKTSGERDEPICPMTRQRDSLASICSVLAVLALLISLLRRPKSKRKVFIDVKGGKSAGKSLDSR